MNTMTNLKQIWNPPVMIRDEWDDDNGQPEMINTTREATTDELKPYPPLVVGGQVGLVDVFEKRQPDGTWSSETRMKCIYPKSMEDQMWKDNISGPYPGNGGSNGTNSATNSATNSGTNSSGNTSGTPSS
jgi:hypothetical protein